MSVFPGILPPLIATEALHEPREPAFSHAPHHDLPAQAVTTADPAQVILIASGPSNSASNQGFCDRPDFVRDSAFHTYATHAGFRFHIAVDELKQVGFADADIAAMQTGVAKRAANGLVYARDPSCPVEIMAYDPAHLPFEWLANSHESGADPDYYFNKHKQLAETHPEQIADVFLTYPATWRQQVERELWSAREHLASHPHDAEAQAAVDRAARQLAIAVRSQHALTDQFRVVRNTVFRADQAEIDAAKWLEHQKIDVDGFHRMVEHLSTQRQVWDAALKQYKAKHRLDSSSESPGESPL